MKETREHEEYSQHKWRDVAWKKALCDGAGSAIEYFLPDLAADMDLSREVTAITGLELHSSSTDSDRWMRVSDVFLSVPLQNEESGNVALFVEQQHEEEEDFALRVFETYCRLKEKTRKKTTGLVIYTGSARPVNNYFDSCYGFEVSVKYNVFHLPGRSLEELRKDKRPFARVVLAGRLSLDVGDDVKQREKYAWELLKTTTEADYDKRSRRVILVFSRGIFRLEDPKVSRELKEAYEMQTISLDEYVKRIALEEAEEKGIEKGMEKGMKKGIERGKLEVARTMLAEGLSPEIVVKCTGLGKSEILSL
ncbi:MAG: hypothetical protein LBQ42_04145 [Synergistaceae bacterium]|jgi:predicted transposase YdaD|nr:hypothetical protein [Synergistaceae bacterium]